MAARFVLENGAILFDDLTAGGGRRRLQPDETVTVGRLTLTVRARRAAPALPAAPAVETARTQTPTFRLQIFGRSVALPLGARLTSRDLQGLEPQVAEQPVAEVVANPDTPNVLGLKNLSRSPWSITGSDGKVRDIEPGRTFRLERGVQVRFGATHGEIQT